MEHHADWDHTPTMQPKVKKYEIMYNAYTIALPHYARGYIYMGLPAVQFPNMHLLMCGEIKIKIYYFKRKWPTQVGAQSSKS